MVESIDLPHLPQATVHGSLYSLSLGVQLTLKRAEAVVILQVLCLRVAEHMMQHGKLAFLQCTSC